MKLKKVLAIVLVASMTLALAACGKTSGKDTGSNGSTPTKSAENNGGSQEETKIDTSKHVELTFLALGTQPTNGRMEAMLEKLNAILTEKVNASIKWQYIPWADWQTQYNLQLASGDSKIDLITTATDWLFAWQNTEKGAFLPLTEDMLKTYAPQTWANVPQSSWDDCTYNGEIYFIPEDNFAQYINHGVFYCGDWATEFGVPEIKNFEDLGKYFQGVKDNKEGVIPWDIGGGVGLLPGYMSTVTRNVVIPSAMVGNYEVFMGVSPDDPYTVTSPYMEGTYLEDAAKMFKAWNDAGYWREDVLSYQATTRDLFYAGTSGIDQHHSMTYYTSVRPEMDKRQPGSDVKMFAFSEPTQTLFKTSITHQALAISTYSKNPERALMVYDLLRNDKECHMLINYGIEGEDYIITDGKLDRPEGFDATTDSLGSNFWAGRNDDLMLDEINWWDGKNDLIAHYDTYAKNDPYGRLVFSLDNIAVQMAAMSDVCANYLPLIAYGKMDNPEAFVQEFREAMKAAGYDEAKADIQRQLDELK